MVWKKLFGGRSSGRSFAPGPELCDSCNTEFDRATGYYLPTSEVVLSETYWAHSITIYKTLADTYGFPESQRLQMLEDSVSAKARDRTGWAICESCSEYFFFDRGEARALALNGTQPPCDGKLDPSGFVLWAALGWQRVYGTWPANVVQPPLLTHCDFCQKPMYDGEFHGSVSAEALAHHRASGFLSDPVGPPHSTPDGDGWTICIPCMAVLNAKSYRANHATD